MSNQQSRRRKAPARNAVAVIETQQNPDIVPYDENLLERARTQWQFGDWQSLAKLNRDTLQHHPDRAKLALLAAAGRLQIGLDAEAKQYIRLARDWGVSNALVTRLLAAGVHNSLGRASAIIGEQDRAQRHFLQAIATGAPSSDVGLLAIARINHQYAQLDRPPVIAYLPEALAATQESPRPLFLKDRNKTN